MAALFISHFPAETCHHIFVKSKKKLEIERENAYKVADLILESLDKLPRDEQEARINKIRKIKIRDRRSNSKRVSTQPKSHRSHPTEAPQRKRARR